MSEIRLWLITSYSLILFNLRQKTQAINKRLLIKVQWSESSAERAGMKLRPLQHHVKSSEQISTVHAHTHAHTDRGTKWGWVTLLYLCVCVYKGQRSNVYRFCPIILKEEKRKMKRRKKGPSVRIPACPSVRPNPCLSEYLFHTHTHTGIKR